ncbi:transposase [Streptomyces sp. NPDC006551]|uniref:IS701 family transposase n=1 Tax=Streptomyces sp. NPDC006551 TaxID=3157178 RepID=UPI0033B98F25
MNTTGNGDLAYRLTVPHRVGIPTGSAAADHVLAELGDTLFSSFRRKDQRRKAERYLHGLLTTRGRKSIRNIALQLGGSATEQSLHHFIASSTWDWRPLRAALASHLERTAAPQAWVVRQMEIPKAGEHSVGVDRRFAPRLGHMFRGQQASGVWLASQELSAPVDWRLHLSDQWVNDRERRDRAEVPHGAEAESPEECTVAAALETVRHWGAPRRPVLIDLRCGDATASVARLAAANVPFLARISGSRRLSVADRALPGFGSGSLPAQRIVELVKGMRAPVHWRDPAAGHASRVSLAALVPVAFPERSAAPRRLSLLGEWEDPTRPPSALWLTGMAHPAAGPLLRLTRLTRRVDADFARVGEEAGLRDYVGRSFRGWHRHTTLASVAHAAVVLSAAADGYGTDRPAELASA